MKLIEKTQEMGATFGTVLEENASELTQGPCGFNFEQHIPAPRP